MSTARITTPAVSRIKLRRAYESASASDGQRFLVDRLWPRGLTKAAVSADAWLKEVAPSTELRKWFAHDPVKWPMFEERYRRELAAHPEVLTPLLDAARTGPITLVYGAKDEHRNAAVVLREFLGECLEFIWRRRPDGSGRQSLLRLVPRERRSSLGNRSRPRAVT